MVEHGLPTPDSTDALLQGFHREAYRFEAALLATPAAASRLGIQARYQVAFERTGYGRYSPEDHHDIRFRHLATVADWINADPRMDAVAIDRRGEAEPIHRNERGAHRPLAGTRPRPRSDRCPRAAASHPRRTQALADETRVRSTAHPSHD